jgi:hypothetical protein
VDRADLAAAEVSVPVVAVLVVPVVDVRVDRAALVAVVQVDQVDLVAAEVTVAAQVAAVLLAVLVAAEVTVAAQVAAALVAVPVAQVAAVAVDVRVDRVDAVAVAPEQLVPSVVRVDALRAVVRARSSADRNSTTCRRRRLAACRFLAVTARSYVCPVAPH